MSRPAGTVRRRLPAAASFMTLLLFVVAFPRHADTLTRAPGALIADWPTADGGSGNHYSPLSDITSETVSGLELAWSYRTGDVSHHRDGRAGTAFEATPVMVAGVLYVSTPAGRAIALDAASSGRSTRRWTGPMPRSR